MKYSRQREEVWLAVLNSSEHPTAEMVYQIVRERIPNISLGTVYRNLNQLAEQGAIQKIPMPGNSDRFDKTVMDHCHLYCVKCHKIYDIPSELIEELDQKVSEKTHYTILSHNLIFHGLCQNCK